MIFPHYEPESPVLKEFIDFFYFLEHRYEEPIQFYAFPHLHKPLNFHKGITHTIENKRVAVKGSGHYQPTILLQGVYTEPILVQFSGQISKVTIVFKDGALNNFMSDDFAVAGAKHTQVFDSWHNKEAYAHLIKTFFQQTNHLKQIQALEQFLLATLQVRSDWELYKEASTYLKNMDEQMKVADVAKKIFVSERTLYRLIYKYNGISPLNFKKIAQFRHSLETKFIADNFKFLTDVAYSSNYYDPSYFNKIYKSLTRKSPKSFFKDVALYCDKKVVFEWDKNG